MFFLNCGLVSVAVFTFILSIHGICTGVNKHYLRDSHTGVAFIVEFRINVIQGNACDRLF